MTDTPQAPEPALPAHLGIIAAVRSTIGLALMASVLLISAGRVDWMMAWAYLALVALSLYGTMAYLLAYDRELLAERLRVHRGTKTWDRYLVPLIVFVFPLAQLVVAGLDHRLGWSPPYHIAWQWVAWWLAAEGVVLIFLAMRANTFFAPTVRLQQERGQTVISSGPYAFVRHPGYIGAMVGNVSASFVLGSFWSLIPSAFIVVLLILRTALEDRMLHRELDGYADYAARVRYRLIPFVW